MNKIAQDLRDKIIEALKKELEYVDQYGDSQWIMAVSLKEISKGSYLTRTIIKTNNSPYVDGTDIRVDILDGQGQLDLSFAEEEPIFHGGEVDASIAWLEELNPFSYIQGEDPFEVKDIYLRRLKSAIDSYSFKDIGDFNSFDSHVRNIINLYKALLLETLLLEEDILVDGVETSPGQYKLKVGVSDMEFNLDPKNKDTKRDIVEEILNEIISPIIEAEKLEDEKDY